MLSVPDMAIIGVLALIFFGPDQLPRVAKRVGHVVRDVQNTSQAFIRELERSADEYEPPEHPQKESEEPAARSDV
jgi:Sec-independent protein translocase protein TatA